MLKLAHKGHRTAICMAAQSIPLGSPGMIKREREHAGGWQRRNAQGPWRLRLFPMSSTNYPARPAAHPLACGAARMHLAPRRSATRPPIGMF